VPRVPGEAGVDGRGGHPAALHLPGQRPHRGLPLVHAPHEERGGHAHRQQREPRGRPEAAQGRRGDGEDRERHGEGEGGEEVAVVGEARGGGEPQVSGEGHEQAAAHRVAPRRARSQARCERGQRGHGQRRAGQPHAGAQHVGQRAAGRQQLHEDALARHGVGPEGKRRAAREEHRAHERGGRNSEEEGAPPARPPDPRRRQRQQEERDERQRLRPLDRERRPGRGRRTRDQHRLQRAQAGPRHPRAQPPQRGVQQEHAGGEQEPAVAARARQRPRARGHGHGQHRGVLAHGEGEDRESPRGRRGSDPAAPEPGREGEEPGRGPEHGRHLGHERRARPQRHRRGGPHERRGRGHALRRALPPQEGRQHGAGRHGLERDQELEPGHGEPERRPGQCAQGEVAQQRHLVPAGQDRVAGLEPQPDHALEGGRVAHGMPGRRARQREEPRGARGRGPHRERGAQADARVHAGHGRSIRGAVATAAPRSQRDPAPHGGARR